MSALGPTERSALMETAALIRKIILDASRYAIRALPFTIRALAVGGGLMGAIIAVYQTWETFGQDPAALVSALPWAWCRSSTQ